MSPWRCSHSGLSRRDTSSISSERSTSVIAKRALRCTALCPPPLPSSSTSRTGIDAESSTPAAKAASSAYSSGGEISGHQAASSP